MHFDLHMVLPVCDPLSLADESLPLFFSKVCPSLCAFAANTTNMIHPVKLLVFSFPSTFLIFTPSGHQIMFVLSSAVADTMAANRSGKLATLLKEAGVSM